MYKTSRPTSGGGLDGVCPHIITLEMDLNLADHL